MPARAVNGEWGTKMNGKQEQGRQRTLHRLPRWALVPVFTIALTAWLLGVQLLQGNALRWVDVALTVTITFIGALFVLWFVRWHDAQTAAQPSGWPTNDRFQSAVSTGRLPEGADAEQWMPKLRRAAAQERRMVWIGPLFFAAFSAMGVYLVLDDPAHPWFGWLVSLVFAAMAVYYPWWSVRQQRRLQRLMAQFTEEATCGNAA